jgi:hypothetical protein
LRGLERIVHFFGANNNKPKKAATKVETAHQRCVIKMTDRHTCQTGIGSCLKYSVVKVIDTLVSVFSKEQILVLPVLRGVSDIDGTFL